MDSHHDLLYTHTPISFWVQGCEKSATTDSALLFESQCRTLVLKLAIFFKNFTSQHVITIWIPFSCLSFDLCCSLQAIAPSRIPIRAGGDRKNRLVMNFGLYRDGPGGPASMFSLCNKGQHYIHNELRPPRQCFTYYTLKFAGTRNPTLEKN